MQHKKEGFGQKGKCRVAPCVKAKVQGQVLRQTAKIDYENYETAIVALHGVKNVSWPANIPFINPSTIGTVAEIRKICNAWQNGTCHWVKLTLLQLKSYKVELEAHQKAGKVTRKKRKKRSDAGFPRKQQQTAQHNKENGQHTLNRKTKTWETRSRGYRSIMRAQTRVKGWRIKRDIYLSIPMPVQGEAVELCSNYFIWGVAVS
ncbi:hypothetical protein SERLA73DRAFT_150281 [Serpula lacrymans var. lacrymans S7.3]|uniref:Uncharacterized protein n=1 Tax=Serpula lacrymans var. lacrymans (strain S7.3) TaxID=936435 RepID=F8PLW4_SERL3|nr:hypothetical protein SERLA73DRAFT_150281 [Serpula lacrymans var. lacrymans S7.3]